MTLVRGTGETMFTPIEDGDDILLTIGPSSPGWYVSVAGSLEHTAQNVFVAATLTALEENPPIVVAGAGADEFHPLALMAYDDFTCTGMFWGVRTFVDDHPSEGNPNAFVCSLGGQRVELTITVTELGTALDSSDSRSVSSTVVGTADVEDSDEVNYCE